MPLQFMLFFLLSASLWALWVQSRCWTVCQGKESFELLCLCLRRSWLVTPLLRVAFPRFADYYPHGAAVEVHDGIWRDF